MIRNQDALTVTLATALIHYQAPKHHIEAKGLFETVLSHNPSHGGALVGLGLILEEQGDYRGAVDLLNKALAKDPGNVRIMAEAAWCNVLQGSCSIGQQGLEECLEKITGIDPRSRDLKAQILWKIGTCIWSADGKSYPSHSLRLAADWLQRRLEKTAKRALIITSSLLCRTTKTVLQLTRVWAVFTLISRMTPPVRTSASRGRSRYPLVKSRLQNGWHEASLKVTNGNSWKLWPAEWRRPTRRGQYQARVSPGLRAPLVLSNWYVRYFPPYTHLLTSDQNSQNYTLAIQSFQSALRSSPTDFHSWVGLGEAYASSGRYTAALKVFDRAEALDETSWFAKYMLANVRRELGEFELACEGYRAVLALREREFGVLVALSETSLAMGWKYVEMGYYGRAADSVVECLEVAEKALQERSDAFNLWKTVGDACMLFSWVQNLAHKFPREQVMRLLESDFEPSEFDIMAEVDEVGRATFEKMKSGESQDIVTAIYAGILAYKRAIFATADDRHAHAVAWYNLGTAEYRTYVALPSREMKHRLAAIRCFKRTIKIEPGNHEFWNALGLATAELNPKVAQHSLVRALYINDKVSSYAVNS